MFGLVATSLYLALFPAFYQSFEDIRDLIRRGQLTEALAASDQVLKAQPSDFRVWTLKGIALQSLARQPESLKALRRALELRPDFLPALQASAQVEYQMGDPAARKTLERVIAIRPDPSAHAMLGVLAFEQKDCNQSVRHFEKSTEAIGAQPLARWQFATCLFQLGRFDEAEQHFLTLLQENENDQVRYNLGLTRFSAQHYVEAIAALEPLRRRVKPQADALSLLATAYEANKQTPEAVAILRQAIDLHPREERLYIDLAGLCLEHNSIPVAIEVMEIGVKNHPRSARMQTVMGLTYARAGNNEKATQHYALAEELAPREGFGPVARAMMMLQMGAADEAVILLREQRRRGTNANVDVALAQALMQKGVQGSELEEVEQLLAGTSADGDPRVHTLRAKLYLLRDQPQKAAEALEAAVRLDPNDRRAVYQLMTVYRRLGRSAEVKKLQERVKELLDSEKQDEQDSGRYLLISAPAQSKAR